MEETIENNKEKSGKVEAQNDNGGCTVDWNWLKGRVIANVWSDLQNIIITFEDGLVFKTQVAMYKGEGFLAFVPYKDPAK
jgi:hypothetical protein